MSDNNRAAANSYIGYIYQRYYGIYLFLKGIISGNIFLICEEGLEDLDITINNNKVLYQLKYYKDSNKKESLTIDSGLFKVIKSNFNKGDIHKIIYDLYSEKSNYHEELKKAFETKQYACIGRYLIIIYYKSIIKNKMGVSIDINDIINNETIYNTLKQRYNKVKDKDFKNFYDFFSNTEKCNEYLSKFELKKAISYDDIMKEIENTIYESYSPFINSSQNNMYKQMKKGIIINTIMEIFNNKIFNAPSKDEIEKRTINSSEITNKIKSIIETCQDTKNLLPELLKSYEKSIETIDEKHISEYFEETILNDIEKIIKNSNKNDVKQIVSFLIDIYNKNVISKKNDEVNTKIKILIYKYTYKYIKSEKKIIEFISSIYYLFKKKKNCKTMKNTIIKYFDEPNNTNIVVNNQ